MKPIDYVLIIGMTALVLGIIVYLVLNKKKGKTSCGCGCAGCPHAGQCSSVKHANEVPMAEVNDENA